MKVTLSDFVEGPSAAPKPYIRDKWHEFYDLGVIMCAQLVRACMSFIPVAFEQVYHQ